MVEIVLDVAIPLVAGAAGYALGRTRANALLADARKVSTGMFRRQMALLRPACAGSTAALALADALEHATGSGLVSLEALRREISLAIEQEQATIRDPWIRSTTDALLAVHQAAACLNVVGYTAQRERLLVQDAQDALDRAQQALVPRGTSPMCAATT